MSEPKKLYTQAVVEKAEDGEFTAIASTASEDRHGEIVEVEGWDLKGYKANPVILFGHKHDEPPIGKATRVWVDKTGKKPVLKFKAFITDATERAREIKQLMAEGIMKTFSVSFRALDAEGNRFTKQELLEISAVNVPANAEAQMLAYKSLKGAGFDKSDMRKVGVQTEWVEELGTLKEHVKMLEDKLMIAVKGIESLAPHNGRVNQTVTTRLALVKSIARNSDSLLKQKAMSRRKRERLVKAVKQASENLIISHKSELNGNHKGPTRKSR